MAIAQHELEGFEPTPTPQANEKPHTPGVEFDLETLATIGAGLDPKFGGKLNQVVLDSLIHPGRANFGHTLAEAMPPGARRELFDVFKDKKLPKDAKEALGPIVMRALYGEVLDIDLFSKTRFPGHWPKR